MQSFKKSFVMKKAMAKGAGPKGPPPVKGGEVREERMLPPPLPKRPQPKPKLPQRHVDVEGGADLGPPPPPLLPIGMKL